MILVAVIKRRKKKSDAKISSVKLEELSGDSIQT